MSLPKRSSSHQVETESIDIIRAAFGYDWVFRNQLDRDYGIDVHLEHFDGERPTGEILYGQVKGTRRELSGAVSLSGFPVKTINYARLFAIPFFLFHTSTTSKNTYFVWLQKYAELKLPISAFQGQETVTIHFPEQNMLDEAGIEKISRIIDIEREQKVALAFLSLYARFKNSFEQLKEGKLPSARRCCEYIVQMYSSGAFADDSLITNNLLAFDAARVINALKGIEDIENLDRNVAKIEDLLWPLKTKELNYLNMDTTHKIMSWLKREDAPY